MNSRDGFFTALLCASFLLVPAHLIAQSADDSVTFKAGVNLVIVPVVVRDRDGHAVGTFRREDFHVFDKGKPVEITQFSVEKRTTRMAAEKSVPSAPGTASGAEKPATAIVPQQFVAYVFDDVHLSSEELAQLRNAAIKHIETSLQPADRAAVFTTSGQTRLDFTDDRAKLKATLLAIRRQPAGGQTLVECPDLSYFEAQAIEHEGENAQSPAYQAGMAELIACMKCKCGQCPVSDGDLLMAVRRKLRFGDTETRQSLTALEDLVRRMAMLPGERSIVLVSPGFFLKDEHRGGEMELINYAVRSHVLINALNSHGVLETTAPCTSDKFDLKIRSAEVEGQTLAELAEGTGGSYFHNDNGFGIGFRQLAEAPEFVYMLGFSAGDAKPDGSFHELKVKVDNAPKLTLQTRKGYYLPKPGSGRSEGAEVAANQQAPQTDIAGTSEVAAAIGIQQSAPASAQAPAPIVPAALTEPGAATFKAGVNLVQVPVVVRDRDGHIVTGLKKEDFTLLDNGKAAAIVSFSVEKPGQHVTVEKPEEKPQAEAGEAAPAAANTPMVIPDHFVAYVFDDVGFQELTDLTWSRDGAIRHLATLAPGDRVAVVTTSCLIMVDFTSDREKLQEAISKLQFHPHPLPQCQQAGGWNPRKPVSISGITLGQDPLSRTVLRMAALPGQRSIVYVATQLTGDPVILMPYLEALSQLALRDKVVINTLEAGGLHTDQIGADFSNRDIPSNRNITNAEQMRQYTRNMQAATSMGRLGLSALAYGTGGTAVENTNDADAAYGRLGTPELMYVLGFTPALVDNKQHHLKVEVNGRAKLALQARNTYFAMASQKTEAEQAMTAPEPTEESPEEAQDLAAQIGARPAEPPVTFQSKVNLVLVPVVVRDSQGRAIGNLTKDDFELFDKGKPQVIRQFSVETLGQNIAEDRSLPGGNEVGALQAHAAPAAPMVIPDRFIALVFDDQHLQMGGMDNFQQGYLTWARDAARRYVATLRPSDRIGIFTTSGETALDFTSDRAKLEQGLLKLHTSMNATPPSFPGSLGAMPTMNLTEADYQTNISLFKLQDFVKRMSIVPGQRIMVLLSPGFDVDVARTMDLVDRAIRDRVVINTFNVSGLSPSGNGNDNLLFRLADGTGGTYLRDRNDYDSALHQLADAPEFRYILAFTPDNLKQDGSAHELKVRLKQGRGMTVEARKFYWDAKPPKEPAKVASGKNAPPPLQKSEEETKELAEAIGANQPQPLVAKAEPPNIPAANGPPAANAPEMTTSADQPVTFKSKVNLVMVPVVVRDAKGEVLGNLTKADFQLFDKGKKQEITQFTVEKVGAQPPQPAVPAETPGAEPEQATPAPIAPVKFVAYVFDDVHLQLGDIPQVQTAAGRTIDALQPTARAAIFTTSGQGVVDFTDDRAKLHDALLKLRPRPIGRSGAQQCPDVSYYMADQMINKYDLQNYGSNPALQAAAAEVISCMNLSTQQLQIAISQAQSAGREALNAGEHESRTSLIVLKDIARRVALMPGQRNIILVSPGFFLTDDLRYDELDVVDRAVRANVVISALDARGLYVINPAGDISQRTFDANAERLKDQYRHMDATASADVMAEMAAGTGGTFIQNTNDLAGGLTRLATAPEYIYMLGFAPDNLKPDGSFHPLKVTVNSARKLNLQARHGYFAPKKPESEEAAAKEVIDEAVFSRDEIHELPVELHTQFFKPSDTQATLKVLATVDLKQLAFRKDQDRNKNDLTIVSALFDTNGNFVSGVRKILQMRLLDTTMEKLKQTPPVKISSSFDVAPGSYLIRLVVRDSEGHLMATENGAVQIP